MRPSPSGQIPASARNRLDLPVPDGPLTSNRSAGARSSAGTDAIGSPLGSRTTRSFTERAHARELAISSAAPPGPGWSPPGHAGLDRAPRVLPAPPPANL